MRVNIAQSTPPSLSSLLSKSTLHTPPRISCSGSTPFDGHDFAPKHNTHKTHKHHHLKFSTNSFRNNNNHAHHHVDLLEPSFLGIQPNPPDWPERDDVIRDCIARRASSIELPLSLRMIKLKQRFSESGANLEEIVMNNNNNNNNNINITKDSVSNICCSTLYIIREVQIQALKNAELDNGVLSKVQREMTSSFLWLFKDVFAKTPDLMLDVLVLTSTFAANSLECFKYTEQIGEKMEQNWRVLEEREMGLWDSMVEEANLMSMSRGSLGSLEEKCFEMSSPIKVEVESDEYEEFDRTNLHYQIGLSKEPDNPLLLFNYAQFLRLVSRDYDRAEQCFKRAIQLDPTDAEIVSQYANFLWLVRKDIWRAEESFQRAMATEPDNSYHASKYASFLWSTGGEDTCYPLEPPPRGKS